MPSTPIDRRTVLKGVAWATPVIILTTAAPAFAAGSQPAPPVVYSGPAFVVIGAGGGAVNSAKIYAIGPGPLRGSGNLAPGVRFGWIRPTSSAPASIQTATIEFTPAVGVATAPDPKTLFETFNAVTITSVASDKPGTYKYSVAVGVSTGDPRVGVSGVNSFTVRPATANYGTYHVTGANGRVAQFRVANSPATTLDSQTFYQD